MSLTIEWDEEKARQNQLKHGITFEEAKTVFNDSFSLTISDPHHSETEERWVDIGLSKQGQLLVVCYTERGERIRIISSRKATKIEEQAYAHETR